jgi:hypothetical protein
VGDVGGIDGIGGGCQRSEHPVPPPLGEQARQLVPRVARCRGRRCHGRRCHGRRCRGRRRHDGPAGDAKRRSAAIDGKGGLNPYTACIARRGRRSSRHPNEVGHWEPSVTLGTFARIFVLVLDRGRSRGYRRSCGNGWVVLARNVSRGGSGTEGSPGESSLHRARSGNRESGKDSRVRRSRSYSHGELGDSLISEHILNKLSSRGGSRRGRGSIDQGKGGGRLRGGQQRARGGGPLVPTVLRERETG